MLRVMNAMKEKTMKEKTMKENTMKENTMEENNNPWYIVRTDRAGVFFCQIKDRRGSEADLLNARRLHYFDRATECIGIAQNGIGGNSRVTVSIPEMTVLGVIEVNPCTEKAVKSISEWPEWTV